jgi:hypothetical protein
MEGQVNIADDDKREKDVGESSDVELEDEGVQGCCAWNETSITTWQLGAIRH